MMPLAQPESLWDPDAAAALPARFIAACKEARRSMQAGQSPALWFLQLGQLYAKFDQELDNLSRTAIARQQRVQRGGEVGQAAIDWHRRRKPGGLPADDLKTLARARAELRQAAMNLLRVGKPPKETA